MQISKSGSKKSASSFEESLEDREITSSGSEWKIGSDKLFVTCLTCNSKNKFENQLKITWIFLLILV